MTDMLSVQGSWEEEKTKDTQAREALGSNESAVVDRLGSPVGLRIPVPWDSPYYIRKLLLLFSLFLCWEINLHQIHPLSTSYCNLPWPVLRFPCTNIQILLSYPYVW